MVRCACAALVALFAAAAPAQTVTIDLATRYQLIDGFGTCLGSDEPQSAWWQELYFDDLRASMVRIDITPSFTSTYSNESYCSPWFGQPAPLRLDDNGNGPDGTRTRQYTSAADYSNAFGGCSAPIAVMGPDIDKNVLLFDFSAKSTFGLVAQLGQMKAAALGGFKLYASMWSPAPWVKMSSGNKYGGSGWPLPAANVPWPFIWGGNFAGGTLDVSGIGLAQFNDGVTNTSALTQFARGLAAFLRGFQNTYEVSFHAISIQNELNFEEFYNSATYPLSSQYIAALKAARAELDKYSDLKDIVIMGPEDLMGGDPYSLWQYGSGATATHKNLQYLQAVAADPVAAAALGGFAIHGYAPDGISAAGADPNQWNAWTNGWTASPAGGIPANVGGFASYGKPSWMTETSGELPEWLASSQSGGFPDQGAFSIAIKLHQALTAGMESAWLYWQITDGNPADDSHTQSLTDATQLAQGAKYVAAKHFFRAIRPGAQRVAAVVTGSASVLASAYWLDSAGSLTLVLINEAATASTSSVSLPAAAASISSYSVFTSSDGALWVTSSAAPNQQALSINLPGYSVATVTGVVEGGMDGGSDAGVAPLDAGSEDGGAEDAGDAGGELADAGDAGSIDGGVSDAGAPDAGIGASGGSSSQASAKSGCSSAGGGGFWAFALLAVLAASLRSRGNQRSSAAPSINTACGRRPSLGDQEPRFK